MPGAVLEVLVKEGARVHAGDVIMIISAMKMGSRLLPRTMA